jgi:hypothetical protein
VAEWISRYNTGAPAGVATDFYGRPIGMQPTPTYTESRLRLTFDTNHVLTAWSRR